VFSNNKDKIIFYIENKKDNFVPWLIGTTLFTVSVLKGRITPDIL
jgi:hypothetical protein